MAVPGQAEASRPVAAEFFAGIGLARMGLEEAGFDVRWSNDNDPDKHAMYVGHFRRSHGHTFVRGDVGEVKGGDMPDDLAVAWASFPCIDLSLAGWAVVSTVSTPGRSGTSLKSWKRWRTAVRRSWSWKTSWASRPATKART